MEDIYLRNYAYLGDAVWELFIRNKTIHMTNNSKKLHKITTSFVKTEFQCELLYFLEKFLSEEEIDIAKRARNLPIPVGRKKIQSDYRQSTAFEALIGFWYLNNKPRYDEIIDLVDDKIKV